MKIQIGIAGVSGRIGQRLVNLIEKDKDCEVVCGLVSKTSSYQYDGIEIDSVCKKAGIWIDFSTPQAFDKVLAHCLKSQTPLLTGTTGLSKEQFKAIEQSAHIIPILWASNFAISICLIQQLLSKYTKLVETSAEITETHHIHKIDKPSGTALTLAKSIKPQAELVRIDKDNFKLDGISIQSIREKEVPGIHQIELSNNSESLTITHRAKTPEIFAQGAFNVAKWLIKQEKGLYTMNDFIDCYL